MYEKSQGVNLGFDYILRHSLVYFLIGCTSAEPISAFNQQANIYCVNGIQD